MTMITNFELTEEEWGHLNYVIKMFQLLRNTAIDDVVSDELCENNFCETVCNYLENFKIEISDTIRRTIA